MSQTPMPQPDQAPPVDVGQPVDEAEAKRRRFKTHGRKKGKVNDTRLARIEAGLLALSLPPGSADRGALIDQLGGNGQSQRVILEIGFGNGETLAALAARHPEDCFIGIDVFLEGFGTLLNRLTRGDISNVRLVCQNALQVLLERIPDASLDGVIINFPDPWRKKRHFKRRIVQTEFLDALAPKMRSGADLTLATDWANYAEWMVAHLEPHTAFVNQAEPGPFAAPPPWWIETNFERKGVAAGRIIRHLHYKKR
ncbi:tRNA (guanine-N(7)-)-methyltransferase [Magnetococcus marinus MC-1]|uniref:tRNA (guanine-N(7)-)-methyltransferase n=1 Tax=Magnetococcus marinus (strain ATCC BAA-1437 / JCM 17883 / MC-1) TaxID=156889 RepID=TRMB_MAGMM|nr:tRNA (guanosine(46)-N7)-methyltransferase TrmB [Magnetococcus marinus]A0L4N8.1 RecName: Full=tRNA (guanine-N(7)-)-methyltransferase; AltName: Full=tRNA (guanine(46)-N(7))-methyltransferase; AltName: Full=tRNA(m7G46)-methyltransferase [Magnetococcus marinus MC-1]ABK42931.1 tRNA (guanine-N(7)-)-methyltransferase [Magnetococcus marinus MC-1]